MKKNTTSTLLTSNFSVLYGMKIVYLPIITIMTISNLIRSKYIDNTLFLSFSK